MTSRIHSVALRRFAVLAIASIWLSACGGGGGGGGGTTSGAPVAPIVAAAEGPPSSGAVIVQVNTSTAGLQQSASVAALAGGGSVDVWATGSDGIFMQRFAADGSAVGAETRLDTPSPDFTVWQPKVAGLPDGGFLVQWQAVPRTDSPHPDHVLVEERRFAADGTLVRSRQDSSNWLYFDIVGLQNGGVVRILEGQFDASGARDTIGVERYGADGSLVDTQVLDTVQSSSPQPTVSAFALEDGRRLLSWLRSDGVGPAERMIQFVTSDGVLLGQPQSLGLVVQGFQPPPGAALRGGGFVMLDVVQVQGFASAPGYQVYAQRYLPDATPNGPPVLVDGETDIMALGTSCYTAYGAPCPFPWQAGPGVAGTPDGGFVVSWGTPDRRRPGRFIYARQFDAGGLPTTGPLRISIDSPSGYGGSMSMVTRLGNGFAITWQDHDADQWGIFSRFYPAGALN